MRISVRFDLQGQNDWRTVNMNTDTRLFNTRTHFQEITIHFSELVRYMFEKEKRAQSVPNQIQFLSMKNRANIPLKIQCNNIVIVLPEIMLATYP